MTTTDETPTPPTVVPAPTAPAPTAPAPTALAPIGPGARLLHIGIPKTGTTAIQSAASSRRAELLEQGVCYPGRTFNHREQAAALMGRQHGWSAEDVPAVERWTELMESLAEHPDARGFVSHEFIAECDDAQAQRFVDELGPDLHVVISLRGFADLLGSTWQQYVKAGNRFGFPYWLKLALADPPSSKLPRTFARRNDQAAIVQRWVRAAGADNVTVIVVDKAEPARLTDTFEQLLALPPGTLVSPEESGFAANRTLSLAEAELIRGLNRVIGKKAVDWEDYEALVRAGTIARIQDTRVPGPHEPDLRLPKGAARKALVRARGYADAVEASGARIVGDVATLYRPVATVNAVPTVEQIPLDVAVQALAGMLSAATGQKASFDPDDERFTEGAGSWLVTGERGQEWLRSYTASRRFTTGSLAGAIVLRGIDRVKRVRRR